MKNLNKIILISALSTIAAIGLYVFLISPNIKRVIELNSLAVKKQTELQTLNEQIVAYKNSKSDLKAIGDKDKVTNFVLEREDLQDGIAQLEAAAKIANVTETLVIKEEFDAKGRPIDPKPILKGESNISEVIYTMTVSGDFNSLLLFIKYLEHLPHFTEVSRLNINSTTNGVDKDGLASHAPELTGTIDGIFVVKKAPKK